MDFLLALADLGMYEKQTFDAVVRGEGVGFGPCVVFRVRSKREGKEASIRIELAIAMTCRAVPGCFASSSHKLTTQTQSNKARQHGVYVF